MYLQQYLTVITKKEKKRVDSMAAHKTPTFFKIISVGESFFCIIDSLVTVK